MRMFIGTIIVLTFVPWGWKWVAFGLCLMAWAIYSHSYQQPIVSQPKEENEKK